MAISSLLWSTLKLEKATSATLFFGLYLWNGKRHFFLYSVVTAGFVLWTVVIKSGTF